MKIKFLTLATVVAFLFASCGGVDKQLVENVDSFEKDWTDFSASFKTTGDNIKMESDKLTKDCDETCAMDCSDKKVVGAVDSCKDICKMNKSDMSSLMTNFNDYKTNTVDKTGTEFAAWKDKVKKGEVKTEDANKELDAYKAKLTDGKDQLSAFKTSFETIKASCEASCNEVKAKCAAMDDKSKKKTM